MQPWERDPATERVIDDFLAHLRTDNVWDEIGDELVITWSEAATFQETPDAVREADLEAILGSPLTTTRLSPTCDGS